MDQHLFHHVRCHLVAIVTNLPGRHHHHATLQIRMPWPSAQWGKSRAAAGTQTS